MKKLHIVLLAIIGLALILSAILFFGFGSKTNSSPPQILPQCNTLANNGEDAINLLFLAPEEKAQEYINYFLSLKPFDSYQDSFNFYSINEKGSCDLYQGIALFCDNDKTHEIAAACPHDYIAVVEDRTKSIRSSAYQGVMSINGRHALSVFPHEFGHVFPTHFAEEYSTSARIPRDSENCQRSCEDLKEILPEAECNQECTKSNYFRDHPNGFMRTLSATQYGALDEFLLEQELIKLTDKKQSSITGFATQENQAQEKTFKLIKGQYNKETNQVEILEKKSLPGYASGTSPENGLLSYTALSEIGEIESGTTQQEYIFIEDDTTEDVELNGQITEHPRENLDRPFFITIQDPQTDNLESLQIQDQQGNLLIETSLYDVGARPCLI